MSVHNKYDAIQVIYKAIGKVDELKESLYKFRNAIENDAKLDKLADNLNGTLIDIDDIL